MKRSFLFVTLSLAASPALPREERVPLGTVLDRIESVRGFGATAISPDGNTFAWTDRFEAGSFSTIHLASRQGGGSRVLSAAKDGKAHREGGVAFSRDGKWVAFLSDALQEGQLQVYLVPTSGGQPTALTQVVGQLDEITFAPNGKSLAVLFVKGSTQATGALVAYRPDSGPVGDSPEEQRVAVIDLTTHAFKEVSPEKLYVYDYDWSPDSQSIAVEATEGSGTNNYWVAELDRVDVEKGTLERLWKPPLQLASPRYAPDGKTVAVIHGIMSDEGSNGGDIFSVPVGGGEPRNLTPGMKASAKRLEFDSKGNLFFLEDVAGEMGIGKLGPGGPETVWKGPERLSHFRISSDGSNSVLIRESFTSPPEVYLGPVGSWSAATHDNSSLAPYWGQAINVHWQNEGLSVQGWLVPPKSLERGRLYPLVVVVHGGPSAAATAGWPSGVTAALPSEGTFVFLPNPRGSYGSGEAFTEGNVKDFGYGDFRDILAGVDAVLKTEPIDRKRLGIFGWSYGGYMTMWAVTQTTRFSAAVAGAGIVSWQSYYGQNRIDRWMIPFFGASVYDDPWIYARSSPISFIKETKTPTLVLHGDRDSEVPTPQGYEFWHALKSLGVPTELVIYEGEGHHFNKPEHARDVVKRTVEWFEKYLGSSARAHLGGTTSSPEETSKRR
jgi:dipeptidyl aminopeptidase/acylaminoacyl peptidase